MSTLDANQYVRNAVMQAGPEQLQLMLFDGAIRFALKGREAIENKDYEKSYESLSRAQKILVEMEAGLRREANPELCDQMAALYNFVYRKLVSACVKRETSHIDDALKILRHQRETWGMLLEKVAKEVHGRDPHGATESAQVASLSVEG